MTAVKDNGFLFVFVMFVAVVLVVVIAFAVVTASFALIPAVTAVKTSAPFAFAAAAVIGATVR